MVVVVVMVGGIVASAFGGGSDLGAPEALVLRHLLATGYLVSRGWSKSG